MSLSGPLNSSKTKRSSLQRASSDLQTLRCHFSRYVHTKRHTRKHIWRGLLTPVVLASVNLRCTADAPVQGIACKTPARSHAHALAVTASMSDLNGACAGAAFAKARRGAFSQLGPSCVRAVSVHSILKGSPKSL